MLSQGRADARRSADNECEQISQCKYSCERIESVRCVLDDLYFDTYVSFECLIKISEGNAPNVDVILLGLTNVAKN